MHLVNKSKADFFPETKQEMKTFRNLKSTLDIELIQFTHKHKHKTINENKTKDDHPSKDENNTYKTLN